MSEVTSRSMTVKPNMHCRVTVTDDEGREAFAVSGRLDQIDAWAVYGLRSHMKLSLSETHDAWQDSAVLRDMLGLAPAKPEEGTIDGHKRSR